MSLRKKSPKENLAEGLKNPLKLVIYLVFTMPRITQIKKAKYSALSVAKYLFTLDPERKYFSDKKKISTGEGFSTILLGNWRLNQILYLLQVFHYVKYDKFLFQDDLYAFDNGFIIYDAYRNFWTLYNGKWFDIEVEGIKENETKNFLDHYFHYFQQYTNQELQEFYKEDPAWIDSWLENKTEPKIEFSLHNLSYYQTFLPNHIRYIEKVS